MLALTAIINNADVEENQELAVAFPDKYIIRFGAYIVDGSDTQFSETSDIAPGTVIDYSRDPDGEDTGAPVSEDYKLPFQFTGEIEEVVIELKG